MDFSSVMYISFMDGCYQRIFLSVSEIMGRKILALLTDEFFFADKSRIHYPWIYRWIFTTVKAMYITDGFTEGLFHQEKPYALSMGLPTNFSIGNVYVGK